jgi:hypothetical protein
MRQEPDLEQRITDLVCQLQLLVRRPTFSFRLAEIQDMLAELAACWDLYRRGSTGLHASLHALSQKQIYDRTTDDHEQTAVRRS